MVDREDPLLDRADPYARRVFRDTHPLDDVPDTPLRQRQRPADPARQHRREGGRRGQHGAAPAGPHLRHPDAPTRSAGCTWLRQVQRAGRVGRVHRRGRPVEEQPAGARSTARGVRGRHLQRGEPVRLPRRPVRRLRLHRQRRLPGCHPPFDYVPAGEADTGSGLADEAARSSSDLQAPDLILVQEAEDQDICTVSGGAWSAATTTTPTARRTPSRSWRWPSRPPAGRPTSRPTTGPARTPGASPRRSCTARTGCRWPRDGQRPAARPRPTVQYRRRGWRPTRTCRTRRRSTRCCPPTSTPRPARTATTSSPGPRSWASSWCGRARFARAGLLYALSNHYSSGPDTRVGQRTEQAATAPRSSPRSRRPTRTPGWSTAGT